MVWAERYEPKFWGESRCSKVESEHKRCCCLLTGFELEKLGLAHHEPAELSRRKAHLLRTCVAFFLVYVEQTLEAIQEGDGTCVVHLEV